MAHLLPHDHIKRHILSVLPQFQCVTAVSFDFPRGTKKPQDAAKALKQTGEALKNKLLISIAAGLSLETLQNLAPGARVVRAMPNTAAIVGRSATAYAAGSDATPQDRELAESIFSSIGEVYPVEEKLLDAVTGRSGSGPAYVFLMIEALADGGVS